MEKRLLAVFLICTVLLMSLVSAGLIDSIRNALTGKAISQNTTVSVNVVGVTPVALGPVDNSTFAGGITPIENNYTDTSFNFTMCDPDGVNDLNDTSVDVQYLGPVAGVRDGSCSHLTDIDGSCANYTCTVTMWYFDEAGQWTINVTGSDIGNQSTQYNDTYTFTYNELKALIIDPDQLNWTGLTPGSTTVNASNDPTTVNNTGNYDGTIKITGYDLYGETTDTEKFGVNNFTADEVDPACGAGIALVNNSAQTITGTDTNPGNLSAGAGAGQEEVYYCIGTVPSVSSQEYTTNKILPWVVAY